MKIFDDELTPNEAKELLLDVLQCTVSFYKVKNWRHVMHFGIPDPMYAKKLQELDLAKKELIEGVEKSYSSEATILKIISSVDAKIKHSTETLSAIEAA